ncbi:hypothetical protein GCM10010129_43680 [Streptomyces fumigatiscleroticus]|nr:hypothetical protein GCM10010129_43680 [Streptomyces fumigatiscleroticus]
MVFDSPRFDLRPCIGFDMDRYWKPGSRPDGRCTARVERFRLPVPQPRIVRRRPVPTPSMLPGPPAGLGRTVGMAVAGGLLMLDPEAVVVDPVLGPATAPVIDGFLAAVRQTLPANVARALTVVPGMRQEDAAFLGGSALARHIRGSAEGWPSV